MINSAAPIEIACQFNLQQGFQQPQQRFRRESINSFGMTGIAWNSTSVGSWLRDEYVYQHIKSHYFSSSNCL